MSSVLDIRRCPVTDRRPGADPGLDPPPRSASSGPAWCRSASPPPERRAGVPTAALAYDCEDATGAPAAREPPQGDRRGLSAEHEVGEEGRGMLLDEALVEQKVGGLEAHIGFEAGVAAQGHGPLPGEGAFGLHQSQRNDGRPGPQPCRLDGSRGRDKNAPRTPLNCEPATHPAMATWRNLVIGVLPLLSGTRNIAAGERRTALDDVLPGSADRRPEGLRPTEGRGGARAVGDMAGSSCVERCSAGGGPVGLGCLARTRLPRSSPAGSGQGGLGGEPEVGDHRIRVVLAAGQDDLAGGSALDRDGDEVETQ